MRLQKTTPQKNYQATHRLKVSLRSNILSAWRRNTLYVERAENPSPTNERSGYDHVAKNNGRTAGSRLAARERAQRAQLALQYDRGGAEAVKQRPVTEWPRRWKGTGEGFWRCRSWLVLSRVVGPGLWT